MTEDQAQSDISILLVGIDEDDEQHIRDALDGVVKDEVIARV